MGGIVALLVIMVPVLIMDGIIDILVMSARKRAFQRKMRSFRAKQYRFN